MANLHSVVKFVPRLLYVESLHSGKQQVFRGSGRFMAQLLRPRNSLTFICGRQQTILVISREREGEGEREKEWKGTVPDFNVQQDD